MALKHPRGPQLPMAPDVAYQIIHDELMIDGNARLNVATFVTTWMEEQASRLMAESFDKNMIDKDEYPQTAELESVASTSLADFGTHRTHPRPPAARPSGQAKQPCLVAWR